MAGRVQASDLFVDLSAAGCVVHVAEMVLAFDVVEMVADELILVGEFEEDGEEMKELFDNFGVTFLGFRLVWDLGLMEREYIRD